MARIPEQDVAPTSVPLWRNLNFHLLWWGQNISTTGSQVSLVASPLLLLALTHSPAQAGLLSALRALPLALFGLPAGALVDRWDRQRMMIFCDLGRMLALGSIPLLLLAHQATFLTLAALASVEGVCAVFFSLAESASLPRIVPREQLNTAVALSRTGDSIAQLLGPALGGALFALRQALPFLADALSYLISVLSLGLLRLPAQAERKAAPDSLWREIGAGVGWLWRHPLLRFIALLTWGLTTFSIGYQLILIVLAQRQGASPLAIGVIFAAGGIGSIVGTLAAIPLQRRLPLGRLIIGAAWLWAVTWLFYLIAPDPFWLGVANALGFIIVPVYSTTQYSYRLSVIPDHLQGRVNSVFRLLAFGSQPLGLAITGFLLQWVGPQLSVVLVFVPQAALALVATLHPRLRRL